MAFSVKFQSNSTVNGDLSPTRVLLKNLYKCFKKK